jgi:hypothetical protein
MVDPKNINPNLRTIQQRINHQINIDDLSSSLNGEELNSIRNQYLNIDIYTDFNINYKHIIYRNIGIIFLRNILGFWCVYFNYNRIPHLIYDKDYDNLSENLNIHGGIVIGPMHFSNNNVLGFGIDFAHIGDIVPSFGPIDVNDKYWNINDVEEHSREIVDRSYRLYDI